MTVEGFIHGLSVWALPVVFAVVLHEVAHGWVADRLGDPTARLMGRLTLNPLRHVDPVGTVLIPLALLWLGAPFLFGYAKPVPVDFRRLRRPKRDMVWVALAGPATNFVLAALSALMLAVVGVLPDWFAVPLALMAQASILINLVLGIFNLIPLPPLDGGRVAVGLLPPGPARALASIEPYGFLVIVLLLASGLLGAWLGPLVLSLYGWLIGLAAG
ncbi:MAG: site-2 protease family protein [Mariprofundaceae bacterium]